MTKKLLGLLIAVFMLVGVVATPVSAALTSSQVEAIIGLLQSFGADQATINNVRVSLEGGTPPPSSTTCLDLKYNLYFGIKDNTTNGEVTKLQKFLTSEGVYSAGVTGYFGPATELGVKKWQAQNGVVSSGTPDSTGYGAVGPKTRAAIKAKSCGTDGEELTVNGVIKTAKKISGCYYKSKNNIYCILAEMRSNSADILQNADPKTFEVLENPYAKDRNQVYFFGNILRGADPKTFKVLKEGYNFSIDKNYVYLRENILKGADPKTFKVLKEGYAYSKDKNHIYKASEILTGVDTATFKIFPNTSFTMDIKHVYYGDKIFKIADVKTFKILNQGYSIDKNYVYWNNKIVTGVDTKTFKILDLHSNSENLFFAKDKNYVYYAGEIVEGENPSIFVLPGRFY